MGKQFSPKVRTYITLAILIIAGAVVYELSYMRYQYYDAMASALKLNNTQMGNLMSVFGIVSMISYFPGGLLANKFSCKKLMAISLIGVGVVGLYFATLPSYFMCLIIHALFGMFTSLTFWSAMIKATRLLGDSSIQGKLYGILEGGRGLLPVLYSFVVLAIFNSIANKVLSIQVVMVCFSILSFIGAVLVWLFMEEYKGNDTDTQTKESHFWDSIKFVVKQPTVWYISAVIFSSYILCIGQSYITPYLTALFGITVSMGAFVGIIRTYLVATFAGPIAGIIADKIKSSTKVVLYAFLITLISVIGYILLPAGEKNLTLAIILMTTLSIGVFMTRGVYFATVDEANIPIEYMGTAVGFISFIGFMPETFVYTVIGKFLDSYPGALGYKYTFIFIGVFSLIGVFSSLLLAKKIKGTKQSTSSGM